MKNTNARITDKTEKFLTDHFRTKSAGAEYILAAMPAVMRKFIGMDIKGRFTENELKLMIDAMERCVLSPEMAGQHLPLNVTDGIMLDHIDEKWGVDAVQLNRTLAGMSTPEIMLLEIWIQGFWQAATEHAQDMDEYIKAAL